VLQGGGDSDGDCGLYFFVPHLSLSSLFPFLPYFHWLFCLDMDYDCVCNCDGACNSSVLVSSSFVFLPSTVPYLFVLLGL